MTRRMGAVMLAALVSITGCEIPQRLNGTYEGFRELQLRPGTDPVIARQLRLVRLTAKENGSALLSDQGMALEGAIDYGSKSAQFVPTRIAGISVNVQNAALVQRYTATLMPQKDGSWLYQGTVRLKKATP